MIGARSGKPDGAGGMTLRFRVEFSAGVGVPVRSRKVVPGSSKCSRSSDCIMSSPSAASAPPHITGSGTCGNSVQPIVSRIDDDPAIHIVPFG